MRKRRVWRVVLAGALATGMLGACGDDDDETASSTATTTAEDDTTTETGANELSIEMVDYGYKVGGSLRPGKATITSTNTGKEWHMAGFGKLKEGATVQDLVKALQAAGESEGGEEEDPTAEFIEKELDTPGHILQPGATQTLTVDVLDPGNYVMLCFLPTEGEGTPHFAKGMVNGFTVKKGQEATQEPTADASITLGDEADPVGVPADLKAGKRTFKLTGEGEKGKDFIIGQLAEGKQFDAFDTYFETLFEQEGGPPKGAASQAPGKILASTFEIQPNQTIWVTVDLPAGQTFFVSTTNSDSEEGEDTVDKFVTVNVT